MINELTPAEKQSVQSFLGFTNKHRLNLEDIAPAIGIRVSRLADMLYNFLLIESGVEPKGKRLLNASTVLKLERWQKRVIVFLFSDN